MGLTGWRRYPLVQKHPRPKAVFPARYACSHPYIPAIQEAFRRAGFPIEKAGKVHQVTFGSADGVPVQVVEQQRVGIPEQG